jgi:hypothetical protein
MAWDPTGVGWGTIDEQAWPVDRVEGADIRGTGPTRATANKVSLGRKVMMITVTRVIGITAYFQSWLESLGIQPSWETSQITHYGSHNYAWYELLSLCQALSILKHSSPKPHIWLGRVCQTLSLSGRCISADSILSLGWPEHEIQY